MKSWKAVDWIVFLFALTICVSLGMAVLSPLIREEEMSETKGKIVGGLFTSIISIVSMYVGGYLDKMTTLFESIDGAITSIERVVESVNPAEIIEMSEALNESAGIVGAGVGEGSADVVNQVGNALTNFLKKDDASDE